MSNESAFYVYISYLRCFDFIRPDGMTVLEGYEFYLNRYFTKEKGWMFVKNRF